MYKDSFNRDGYKTVTFMCFGDAAPHAQGFRTGVVLLLISPKILKTKEKQS